ncbi:hypothetical protein LX32DRAFT_186627 [Colletotrichum zoysiae]|uniref:Uncharacterized protein n=1 Tax=Colletotrichum zoysiae TaxID=1216348 RepID=A0AAD9H561_9PEZI|nr:hypothetical protein LX32DRAFT_186627 [Colletotrichum zoysiae]
MRDCELQSIPQCLLHQVPTQARHDKAVSALPNVMQTAGPEPAYSTELMDGDDGIGTGDRVDRERDSALHEPKLGMAMVGWWNQPGSGPARCRCRPRLDLGWVEVGRCATGGRYPSESPRSINESMIPTSSAVTETVSLECIRTYVRLQRTARGGRACVGLIRQSQPD